MKKNKVLIWMAAVMLLTACPNDGKEDNSAVNNGGDDDKISSLSLSQVIADSTSDTINLSSYANLTLDDVTINKSISINGGGIDLSSVTLSVAADGVSLSGLANANVTTTSALGLGSMKISNSSLNTLVLNGGGSNSIELDHVSVTDLTADYPWVRLHIKDSTTNIMNFVAKQNCKIEDDLSTDTSNNKIFVSNLVVSENVIAEVKTVVDKLNILGDNAEINLSRANSFINSVVNNLSSTLLGTLRLTSIEEVKMGTILDNIGITDNTIRQKVQYKTSEIINGIENKTATEYNNVSYNFDKFVKAWYKYKDNQEAQEWKNYTNLRILDKYNGVPITGITSKALQMCQWLTSVDIGENVASIGELAFLGCNNITELYMRPVNPPVINPINGNSNPMLFFTSDDSTSDDTNLSRDLFSPRSDFISAEGIDFFIDWYRTSIFADQDSIEMIDDFNEVLNSPFVKLIDPNAATIGKFLKSESIWERDQIIAGSCAAYGVTDISPSVLIDCIMSEWDKTLTQTNMSQVTIYVPADSVDAYKVAAGWSRYADNIKPITDKAASFEAAVNAE